MNVPKSSMGMKWLAISIGVFCAIVMLIFVWLTVIRRQFVRGTPSPLSFSFPKDRIKKVILKNGMTILVCVNNTLPKVLLNLVYHVGSAHESYGETGFAHLVGRMIFKGTEQLSESDIDSITRTFGATHKVTTSKECTSCFFEVTTGNWEPLVDILADCMKNARFDSQHLASEMPRVLHELRTQSHSESNVMLEKAYELIFPHGHPYHHPILGYKKDLLNVNAAALKDFYKKHYHPNRAVFLVVGDVEPDDVIKKIRDACEEIPSGKIDLENKQWETVTHFEQHSVKMRRDVSREKICFFWHIPGRKNVQSLLVDSVAHYLGKHHFGLLYKRLIDQARVAANVWVKADHLLHGGIFSLFVEPLPGRAQECKEVIMQELIHAGQKTVTQADKAGVIADKQRDFIMTLQDNFLLAESWISSYLTEGDEYTFFSTVAGLNAVTTDSMQHFIRTYLTPHTMHTVHLQSCDEMHKELLLRKYDTHDEFERMVMKKHVRTDPVEELKYAKKLSPPQSFSYVFAQADKELVLSNGLTVLLTRKQDWPTIDLVCMFKDAALHKHSRKGTVIDVMTKMLIEGSEGFAKKDLMNFFHTHGAFVHCSSQRASLSCFDKDYEPIFSRFFHMLTRPAFRRKSLEKLKLVAKDSVVRRQDMPLHVAFRQMYSTLYPSSPYSWQFQDAINDINSLTVRDIVLLHRAYVAPSQVVLSIVGNFSLDYMARVVDNVFGAWHGIRYTKKNLEHKAYKPTSVTADLIGNQKIIAYARPNPVLIAHTDYLPLQLLNKVFFDGVGSRIFEVEKKHGLSCTLSGRFADQSLGSASFDYIMAVLSKQDANIAKKALSWVLNSVGLNAISPREFDQARQMYIKDLLGMFATNQQLACHLAQSKCLGLCNNFYDAIFKRVAAITRDEVNTVGKRYGHDRDISALYLEKNNN